MRLREPQTMNQEVSSSPQDDDDQLEVETSQTSQFRFIDLSAKLIGKQPKNQESKEKSSSNKEDDNQLDVTSETAGFQFVDLSTMSRGQQAKNRHLVRSHVSKATRRAQRKKQEAEQDPNLVAQLSRDLIRTPSPSRMSQQPALNSTISALQTYQGTVTPYLYELFKLYGNMVMSPLYPSEIGEPGLLAVDWFELSRSCPALFHASCYTAATVADLVRSSLFYSVTPEIKWHKIEAIRQINRELDKADVPDEVILAVISLPGEASETLKNRRTPMQLDVSPFKQPFFFMQWAGNFSNARNDPIHTAGYRAIMRAKGGIGQLRQRLVSCAVSFNNVLESSFEISKPPDEPYYALPQVLSRMNDPTKNVPLNPISPHRGSGFATSGLTEEAVTVMMELLSLTVLGENFLEGTLKNPDVLALAARRDRAHLKLLALPTGVDNIYDCCRYSALLFSTGVLFPMPRSTGVPLRLIEEIKKCVDQTGLVSLMVGTTRPLFIWALMLTGIAAAGLSEPWIKETLLVLLKMEGVSRWNEIKKIVESFLWMDFGCNGTAMELWDDIAASIRGR